MVVIPDVRGLHPYYKELAVRFAEIRMDALAIDFLARAASTDDCGESFDFMAQVPAPQGGQKSGRNVRSTKYRRGRYLMQDQIEEVPARGGPLPIEDVDRPVELTDDVDELAVGMEHVMSRAGFRLHVDRRRRARRQHAGGRNWLRRSQRGRLSRLSSSSRLLEHDSAPGVDRAVSGIR
jgi:hypothetical protein